MKIEIFRCNGDEEIIINQLARRLLEAFEKEKKEEMKNVLENDKRQGVSDLQG